MNPPKSFLKAISNACSRTALLLFLVGFGTVILLGNSLKFSLLWKAEPTGTASYGLKHVQERDLSTSTGIPTAILNVQNHSEYEDKTNVLQNAKISPSSRPSGAIVAKIADHALPGKNAGVLEKNIEQRLEAENSNSSSKEKGSKFNGPLYDMDQKSFGAPDLYDDRSEVFECDRSHWRTDVCTLKGDVRVDARRNLVALYPREPGTRRGVEVVKPYPRKWEVEMMKGVHDVVMVSSDPPFGVELEAGTGGEAERDLNSLHQSVASTPLKQYDGTVAFGNSSSWSESDWIQKRRERLQSRETQLGMFDYERLHIGGRLAAKGGTTKTVERHGWVVFDKEKYVSREDVADSTPVLHCDVRHKVSGVVFAANGYTGNIYHDFNDGLLPLYITTQHLEGEFVMIIEYAMLWWFVRYEYVVRQLSNYPAVLLGKETLTHCFPHLIVGLRIHDELTVYPHMMPKQGETVHGFQEKLRAAWDASIYFPPSPLLPPSPLPKKQDSMKGSGPEIPICCPLLSVISRKGSRSLTNERGLISMAKELGFRVQVLFPEVDVPLEWVWGKLRGKSGRKGEGTWGEGWTEGGTVGRVMLGVHGAAMTYFLFLKEGDSFIQVLPLGTAWPAKTYYGDPAIRQGLKYTEYRVAISESTLSEIYPPHDPVLEDPEKVVSGSWSSLKDIYLSNQNVTLDLSRMKRVLLGVKAEMEKDPKYSEELRRKTEIGVCRLI